MAEETVNVSVDNLGASFTPEQEAEALRLSLLYFVMFLDEYGFGIARYPSQPDEQVLFIAEPEAAIEDFVRHFHQYVESVSPPQPREEDVVEQIMRMFSLAGQEVSEEVSEPVIEDVVEVSETEQK